MKKLLEVQNLSLSYGKTKILNEINFTVNKGEYVALLGASGSGKTSLLRSIGGFVKPASGDILLSGESIITKASNLRPINTVFQNYALFPHYNVYQNVAYGPKRQGLSKDQIKDSVIQALAAVDMELYKNRYPAELSGGQQQRVALARAIVNKPTLLLLDEPLGALDLKLRQKMQEELKCLHRQLGMTFLHVTHDQEEALALATRIAVMQKGEIVQYDTGEKLYRQPKNLFVADFLGNSNIFKAHVEKGVIYIGGQPIPKIRTNNIKNADKFYIMIRPENLYLNQNKLLSTVNSLNAQVIDIIFLGSSYKILAKINNQNIHLNLPSNYDAPQVDSEITVYFSEEHVVILDE